MALSKLAVRRLTKLADYMAGLPLEARKHFNIYALGPSELHGKQDLLKCGTTACAMGWAATIPSFRRAGWLDGWHSEEKFFDIDWVAARHLFYCNELDAKTPKQWAARCRKFIQENT